jgi:putative cardiolipin synthase
MGLLIESPRLAQELSKSFDRDIAENVYCLGLSDHRQVCWTDARDDDPEPELTEPGTNVLSRALVSLLSRLPIERYL